MIAHHPTDATLAAYAAGSLPEALALVVATHLSYCPHCRAVTRTVEAVGGATLSDLPPVAMAPDALTRTLARAETAAPWDVPPVRNPGLPPPLDHCDLGRWWPVAPGLRFRPLRTAGHAWGGLLMAGPGRSLPRHGHDGTELSCVLKGSFVDAGGRYQAGDVSEPDFDHDDPPRVDSKDPCVCVIASEGVKLRGMLGMLQRMLGR